MGERLIYMDVPVTTGRMQIQSLHQTVFHRRGR